MSMPPKDTESVPGILGPALNRIDRAEAGINPVCKIEAAVGYKTTEPLTPPWSSALNPPSRLLEPRIRSPLFPRSETHVEPKHPLLNPTKVCWFVETYTLQPGNAFKELTTLV